MVELRDYDFSTVSATQDAIRLECIAQGLTLSAQIAYVLATVEWETAGTFKPVKEAFWLGEDTRKRKLRRYWPYEGRGFVQITWRDNYEKFSDLLGVDMIDDPADPNDNDDPNKALEPKIALFILVYGFKEGLFTGRRLTDYVDVRKVDFVHARRCINGMDHAADIAKLADKYLEKFER